MTYFGFLLRFLVVPIVVLVVLAWYDQRRGRSVPVSLSFLTPWRAIFLLAVVAVVYTTPWDNYLIATRVWWYDPALVTGITLGWVPLEEYVFFVLQTVLTGLWLLFLIRRVPVAPKFRPRQGVRETSVAAVLILWAASLLPLATGWMPGRYLALVLAWALPPVALQLAVGADILWHHRRHVLAAILTAALYYSAVDVLGISGGTWTINPAHTLGVLIGGVLPLEEAVFFLVTNVLLVFGLTLGLSRETATRLSRSVVRSPGGQNHQPTP